MHQEMPTITASAYSSSSLDAAGLMLGHARGLQNHAGLGALAGFQDRRFDPAALVQKLGQEIQPAIQPKETPMTARIVKVYIADPNENLPLDKRVLHTGEEQLTDLTDQELFFEVPIKDLIDKHNADVRTKALDRKATEKAGRDVFLEAIRIRDLKMVVVTVASF